MNAFEGGGVFALVGLVAGLVCLRIWLPEQIPAPGGGVSKGENMNPFEGGGVFPAPVKTPPGFVETFGPMPQAGDYQSGDYTRWAGDLGLWFQNLALFDRAAAAPDWATASSLGAANNAFDRWGVPHPKYYLNKQISKETSEWQALFAVLHSAPMQQPASLAIQFAGLACAEYQSYCLQLGIDPTGGDESKRHPFIRDWPGDPAKPDSAHKG